MEDVDALKQEINELRSKVSELEEKLKKYFTLQNLNMN